MSNAVFHPTAPFSQKAAQAGKFSLTAPQVGLLLALNKQAHVLGGTLRGDGRYEVRVCNLDENSWVKLLSQHPELKVNNHFSRVRLFSMNISIEQPVIVLPSSFSLPSPLPAGLFQLLECANPAIKNFGSCILSCHENGEMSLSYRD